MIKICFRYIYTACLDVPSSVYGRLLLNDSLNRYDILLEMRSVLCEVERVIYTLFMRNLSLELLNPEPHNANHWFVCVVPTCDFELFLNKGS